LMSPKPLDSDKNTDSLAPPLDAPAPTTPPPACVEARLPVWHAGNDVAEQLKMPGAAATAGSHLPQAPLAMTRAGAEGLDARTSPGCGNSGTNSPAFGFILPLRSRSAVTALLWDPCSLLLSRW
jgi:hypothetical protein